jgi:hypothetical protein
MSSGQHGTIDQGLELGPPTLSDDRLFRHNLIDQLVHIGRGTEVEQVDRLGLDLPA